MRVQTQNWLFLPLGMAILLLLLAPDSSACTCMAPKGNSAREVASSRSQNAGADTVILEGTVEKQEVITGPIGAPSNAMSMTMRGAHRAVSVHVLRAYRGQTSQAITVLTGIGGGDCGFDFQTGKQYLIYAERIGPEHFFTSICTGTNLLEHSGPALRFLRGEPPAPDDLLDLQSYYAKFGSQWTGSVCGRVTKPDGSPFDKASVDMTQVRDEPFPPETASDPNLSKPDGTFCIPYISPGKYLLTAERTDYDSGTRWMGYYPGVAKHTEAVPVEVRAANNLTDLNFKVRQERVFTVCFRIATPDGSPPPLDMLGVSIDSPDRDALAYHETQNNNERGVYCLGFVPPGRYEVQTYIKVDFETEKIPAELSKWQMAKQEVDIKAETEIVLKLRPVN